MGDLSSAFLHATGSELCQAAAADYQLFTLQQNINIYFDINRVFLHAGFGSIYTITDAPEINIHVHYLHVITQCCK